jgi:hypothetical protein
LQMKELWRYAVSESAFAGDTVSSANGAYLAS